MIVNITDIGTYLHSEYSDYRAYKDRKPNIEMWGSVEPEGLKIVNSDEPSLTFYLNNKNPKSGYEQGQIFIRLFFPCELLENKKYYGQRSGDGWLQNWFSFTKARVEGEDSQYCFLEMEPPITLYANTNRSFLMSGFNPIEKKSINFYYFVRTPHGTLPEDLSEKEIYSTHKLPHFTVRM